MQSFTLINGSLTRTLYSSDRGFAYGQGVFTTVRASGGQLQLWDKHLRRLDEGCRRLGFPIEGLPKLLIKDIGLLPKTDLVVKIIITAGSGARGYATPEQLNPTRVIQIDPFPQHLKDRQSVALRMCDTRLARQPLLAGLKHLNRLEQVLARSEWRDASVAEGVMLDTEGQVIECTAANLFWVKDRVLYTPDLSNSGVAGVMRAEVLERAEARGVQTEIGFFSPQTLFAADEVFLTNALTGILPVSNIDEHPFAVGDSTMTQQIKIWLHEALSV